MCMEKYLDIWGFSFEVFMTFLIYFLSTYLTAYQYIKVFH